VETVQQIQQVMVHVMLVGMEQLVRRQGFVMVHVTKGDIHLLDSMEQVDHHVPLA